MINEALIDGILVGGQPSDEELARLPERGVSTVITVRMPDELDEPEAPKVAPGVKYVEVPFTGPTLQREHVDRVRAALAGDGNALVHCAAGTRAAVVTAIVASERAREGATGAFERLRAAGFDVVDTPYARFIASYFEQPSARA